MPNITTNHAITYTYISTEPSVQCDECLGRSWVWWAGLVAGLWVGQAFGVFLLLGLGVVAPAPRFLGTQPPCATQALMIKGQRILTPKKELIHLIKKI